MLKACMEYSKRFVHGSQQDERTRERSARGPPVTVPQHAQAWYQADLASQARSRQQPAQAFTWQSCWTVTRKSCQVLDLRGSQNTTYGHTHLGYVCQQQLHSCWHQAACGAPKAVKDAAQLLRRLSLKAEVRRLHHELAEAKADLARKWLALYRCRCTQALLTMFLRHYEEALSSLSPSQVPAAPGIAAPAA